MLCVYLPIAVGVIMDDLYCILGLVSLFRDHEVQFIPGRHLRLCVCGGGGGGT